jgi:hypothetical protein
VWFTFMLSLAIAGGEPADREDEAFDRARAGEFAASTQLLSDLLDEHPGSERACLWQERVFLNEAAQGDPSAMWRAAQGLLARWHERDRPADVGGLARVCRDDVAATLRYLAVRWHHEAQATCHRVRFAGAEWAYRTYLAEFPDAPDGHEYAFYLGMLLVLHARESEYSEAECGMVTCGNPAMEERKRRRERGDPIPKCGAYGPAVGEEAACPWWRAAQDAFVDALARAPDGPHAKLAASAQLSLAASITNHQERERTDSCRTNSAGECIVEGTSPRGPACFEPTAACLAHLTRPDRWPTTSINGFMRKLPTWRAP